MSDNIVSDAAPKKKISISGRSKLSFVLQNQMAEQLLMAVNSPVHIVDSGLQIIWANKASMELYRHSSSSDVIGRYCYEVYRNRDTACAGCPVEETLLTGKPCTRIRFIDLNDGTRKWMETQTWPFAGKKGKINYVASFAKDITRRITAEKSFQEVQEMFLRSEGEWEDIYNTLSDMVTVHDRDFNIIYANKAARETLRLPSLRNAKAKCYEYYHGDVNPPERCPSCECLKTQLPSIHEMFEPHLNKFLEIKTMPRFDNDRRLKGVVHVVRDITDRKKAEEEKMFLEVELLHSQKMQTVGALMGGVVHDLKNMLTAINGYGSLLLESIDKREPLSSYVNKLIGASEKAYNLLHGILSYSRKKGITLEPLNPNDLIKKMEKLLIMIAGCSIELEMILSDENITIMADSDRVEQVLMNLAANAKDAMPDGGRLSIITERVHLDNELIKAPENGKPGMYALIMIQDTGVGMDEKTKETIFTPFFTTKEAGKGTGLGLSIASGIVKQHGGYIDVSSEKGKGSTFKVYLPLMG